MSVPESDYATPAAPLKAFVAELVAAGVRDAVVCPDRDRSPWPWPCAPTRACVC